MRGVRLPRTAALLAEAVAVELDRPDGARIEVDLSGRILGTDSSRTRLFAIKPRRARVLAEGELERARGTRARAIRKEWQGEAVDRWIEVTTPAPRRAAYLGTARRIYYRSNKHGRRMQTYVHDFGTPAPAVYRAGPNFFLVGGKKHVTSAGIED